MNSSGKFSILIVESELSNVQITRVGPLEGISLAFAVGLVAALGLLIRGAFIYYIKYKAPKKRQINKLMLHDQVYDSFLYYHSYGKDGLSVADLAICHFGNHELFDHNTHCDSNLNENFHW